MLCPNQKEISHQQVDSVLFCPCIPTVEVRSLQPEYLQKQQSIAICHLMPQSQLFCFLFHHPRRDWHIVYFILVPVDYQIIRNFVHINDIHNVLKVLLLYGIKISHCNFGLCGSSLLDKTHSAQKILGPVPCDLNMPSITSQKILLLTCHYSICDTSNNNCVNYCSFGMECMAFMYSFTFRSNSSPKRRGRPLFFSGNSNTLVSSSHCGHFLFSSKR